MCCWWTIRQCLWRWCRCCSRSSVPLVILREMVWRLWRWWRKVCCMTAVALVIPIAAAAAAAVSLPGASTTWWWWTVRCPKWMDPRRVSKCDCWATLHRLLDWQETPARATWLCIDLPEPLICSPNPWRWTDSLLIWARFILPQNNNGEKKIEKKKQNKMLYKEREQCEHMAVFNLKFYFSKSQQMNYQLFLDSKCKKSWSTIEIVRWHWMLF